MYHTAHGQTEECVKLTHPLHVSLCQVVVDSDYMYAFAFKGVEIRRKRCHQGLTFTCLHLGYPALMQYDTAYDLHVEMLHTQTSPCTFTADRKRLRQQLVQSLAGCDPFSELGSLVSQLLVCQLLHLFIVCHYLICYSGNLFNFLFIKVSEYFFHQTHLVFPFPGIGS